MKFKVGDKVKLNIYTKEFRWGRAGVGYDEIGKITNINEDGKIYVDFPSRDYSWDGLENELVKVGFSKDDLQFADIVTLRDGNKYVVAYGRLFGEDDGYYENCEFINDDYNSDLIYCNECDEERHDLDIMKVERSGEVIFQRESEVKEMTVAEISEALGYEVKIVKEND